MKCSRSYHYSLVFLIHSASSPPPSRRFHTIFVLSAGDDDTVVISSKQSRYLSIKSARIQITI